MSQLSEQIGEFRRSFGRYVDDGVTLSGEAVEAFDGLFASFQAQARVLEGATPDYPGSLSTLPETFAELCAAAASESKALASLAKRLESTTQKLHSAEIIPFQPRGERA